MSTIGRLSRHTKREVAGEIAARLQKRIAAGAPTDTILDEFQAEIDAVHARLTTSIDGVVVNKGTRAALLAASDESDDVVDCWMRKIYGFLDAEAMRRTGPYRAPARRLLAAAFPEGLAHIDDRVVEENVHCDAAIKVLRAPENAPLLVAIKMPKGWVDEFEVAVQKSDDDFAALAEGRSDKSSHMETARDAEQEWEDVMIRFRHHIAGRAKKGDVARRNEGRELIDPLLLALRKARAEAASRATLRAKPKPAPVPVP